jgi:hypothetical protein
MVAARAACELVSSKRKTTAFPERIMSKPFLALAALLLFPLSASAGDFIVQATGTVIAAGPTSGAFQGVTVGATASLRFEVFTPGTVGSPGFETYDVDTATIVMTIGAGSASGNGGTPTIMVQNGNPGGTDGLRFFSSPITGGSTCVFDFGVIGNIFDTTDISQLLGTWSPTTWSAYDWRIFGGGNNIEISPVTITISNLDIGTPYCFGDGSATACPCANASPVGNASGCLSSLGTGGKLTAVGTASLSGDDVVLNGSQMPNSSALYFQGMTRQSGGMGIVFGDGLRCVGGSIARLKTVTNTLGVSQIPQAGDPSLSVKGNITSPGTRTYQIWYRNAAGFCSASTFNLSNGLEIAWGA